VTSDLAAASATEVRTDRRTPRLRPRLIGELLIVVFLIRVYDLIKELGDRRRSVGLANARHVVALERTLRLDWERSVNQWVNRQHVLALVCSYWYQFAHETITLAVLAWLWWYRPTLYRRARNALIAINVVGLTVFALFPVAPPRLLPGYGIIDSVAAAGFGTTHGGPVPADQYAAMPSLHLAWATWTAAMLFIAIRRPVMRGLACAYPIWMIFVVIGTGNHYVLDAAAGIVVAAASLAAARVCAHTQPSAGGPDDGSDGSAPWASRALRRAGARWADR
jgi:hypothetical protein